MLTEEQKQSRVERARRNGAKSRGPKTPEGLARARTATLVHGAFATEETLSHTVDPKRFEELLEKFCGIWKPENDYISGKIQDLATARWHLDRLNIIRRQRITELYREFGTVMATELHVSEKGNIMERLEARIRRLNLDISRLERDIHRLKLVQKIAGPSQKLLKTQTAK
jgi:hypothetical protein